MSFQKKKNEKNGFAGHSHESSLPSVWARAFTSKSEWPDKDEFLDVIYWLRQCLGLLLGVVWGFVPLNGFIGLLLFAVVNAGLLYLYFNGFQQVDEEVFGGPFELTKEGFMTSFAGFLVLWIVTYSALHYD